MRSMRTAGVAVAIMTTAASCAVDQALPPPKCEGGSAALIVAQSVPTAMQIPCLDRLPDGWSVASVSVNQERSGVRLASDRAGDNAATLHLVAECDTSAAVSAPSDLSEAERYDQIDRLEPFRASRFYIFAGGCVSWTFDFDRDTSATESVAIGDALQLRSRQVLNDSIRETFIDEEI